MTYLIYILCYLIFCLSLFRIAKKTATPRPWLAWIPFVHLWIPVVIAKRSKKWFVLLFVPFANIVAIWIVWGKVAHALGRSAWWGRMMLIPLVNILILPILAFDIHPTQIIRNVALKLVHLIRSRKQKSDTVTS